MKGESPTLNITFKIFRSSCLEVFLGKGALKICSKFTGEHPCRTAISIKLQSNVMEITLWHECSPVNLLHVFRAPLKAVLSRLYTVKFTWSNLLNQINLIMYTAKFDAFLFDQSSLIKFRKNRTCSISSN